MDRPLYEYGVTGMTIIPKTTDNRCVAAILGFCALIILLGVLGSGEWIRDNVFPVFAWIVFIAVMASLVGAVITGIRERRTLRAARERQGLAH